MKLSKLGFLLLVLVLTMSLVVGCGGGNDDQDSAGDVLADGTYEGDGQGFKALSVVVEVEGGKIVDIEVVHEETVGFGADIMDDLVDLAISNQGSDFDIDGFSGATATAEGFQAAIDDALTK